MSLFRSMSYALKQKPFTSISIKIDSLTRYDRPESINDVSGVQELIQVISTQKDGQTEAARAIRKKLKAGKAGSQLRALTILNELIETGGADFRENFIDCRLLNRLKLCAEMPDSNYYVKRKCWSLFKSWSKYKHTNGLTDLAYLYENINHNDLVSIPINYQIPEEVDKKFCTLVHEQESSFFVLDDHREAIKIRIALSVMHSVNLMNALKEFNIENGPTYISEAYKESNKREAIKKFKKDEAHIKLLEEEALTNKNRGEGLDQYDKAQALARQYKTEANNKSKNDEAHVELIRVITHRAKNCREFRGMILDYTDKVTSSEWLGPLLYVNELLITALKMYKNIIQPVGAEFNFDEKMEEDETSSKDKQKESPIASKKIGLSFSTSSQNETERQKTSEQCGTDQVSRGDENSPFVRFAGIGPFVEMQTSPVPFRTRASLSARDPFPNTDPFSDDAYPLSNNPFSSRNTEFQR